MTKNEPYVAAGLKALTILNRDTMATKKSFRVFIKAKQKLGETFLGHCSAAAKPGFLPLQ